MKIPYLENGYLNMQKIIEAPFTFNFVVGARGTGKTFGALDYVYIRPEKHFILMRRTQEQCNTISRQDFSPFKALEAYHDNERLIACRSAGKNMGRYGDIILDENGEEADYITQGYAVALSTVANMRGFDMSDIELLFYDEFIKERHEKPLKDEGKAFLNAYETINRNRELTGRDPVKCVCMANSNDIANPIFIELGLVTTCERMLAKGIDVYTNKERGIAIYLLHNSPISQAKKNTALYRLSDARSEFAKMAISNDFNIEHGTNIGNRKLIEYVPVVQVGESVVYKHKSNGTYYVTTHASGNIPYFGDNEMELKRFCRSYFYLWDAYLNRKIVFESYMLERLFEHYYFK